MIVAGELPAGAALSEVGLAESFGVSRTPVREALKQLQAEGLVEIRPQVGTFVSKPSRREVGEMSRVKEVLEGLAANLMAQRGEVPELSALRENVAESEAVVGKGMTARYAELVTEFHSLILQGSDNRKLQEHHRMLMNQLAYQRLVRTSLKQPGRPARSVAEHRRVLEMIEAKDAEGAERAMREHVRSSHLELMRGLAEEQQGKDDA
jgi:DNA-binding GntR family transcriptional regulator